MPENVVCAGGYIRFIKRKTQSILTDSDVSAVCRKIQSGRLKPSLKTHREHVKHVKTIVEQKQQADDNACQQCGKPMVLRKVKSGSNQGAEFWGCSGYPKCRTVRAIS